MIAPIFGHYKDNWILFWECKSFLTCFDRNCLFTGTFAVHLYISYGLPDMTFSCYPCLLVNPLYPFWKFPGSGNYSNLCSQSACPSHHPELCESSFQSMSKLSFTSTDSLIGGRGQDWAQFISVLQSPSTGSAHSRHSGYMLEAGREDGWREAEPCVRTLHPCGFR